jgi:catechol 2,3-dioxygenase-like lactoylglutathione lyase family enzyme
MVQRSGGPVPDHLRVGGIDHVGITVRSLEQSLAFYRDLLGLRVIEISGELIEYVAASGDAVSQRPNGPGCPHVALRVRDIAEVLQRLAGAGHYPDGKPSTITGAIAWEGATVVYLRDPDGAVIELIQRPEPGRG